jgi:hypothetical protein
MEQELYRVKDFCRCYAISRSALYLEIAAKRIPIIKRGRRTLIAREDAQKWSEAIRQQRPN